jgi:hypothetical protein
MDLGPEFLAEFSSPDREFHTVVTTKEPTQGNLHIHKDLQMMLVNNSAREHPSNCCKCVCDAHRDLGLAPKYQSNSPGWLGQARAALG